jgi:hypothetical protein
MGETPEASAISWSGLFLEPKENQMNRLSIASVMFGVAMLTLPQPAGAQWSAAQKAACQGDAMRLCSQSMADPGQLNACMSRNSSKVSAGCRAAMGGGGKKKKRA